MNCSFENVVFQLQLIPKWSPGGCFQEVNTILQHVVERNRVRRSLSAKRNALRSWRNLVETLLTACPADLIPADERQLIIRDLLLDLHDKVSDGICCIYAICIFICYFSLQQRVHIFDL